MPEALELPGLGGDPGGLPATSASPEACGGQHTVTHEAYEAVMSDI